MVGIVVTLVTGIVAISVASQTSPCCPFSPKASEAPYSLGALPMCSPGRGWKGGWPESDILPAAVGLWPGTRCKAAPGPFVPGPVPRLRESHSELTFVRQAAIYNILTHTAPPSSELVLV